MNVWKEEINDMTYKLLSSKIDDSTGSIGALLNNSVNCLSKNSMLQSFKVVKNNNSYQYDYKCFEHPSISNDCINVNSSKFTLTVHLKSKPLESIASPEFDMKCNDNQGIKGFTLKNDGNDYFYSAICCGLLKVVDKVNEVYASKDQGDTILNVSAQAPTGRVFRNFSIRKLSNNNFQYQNLFNRLDIY